MVSAFPNIDLDSVVENATDLGYVSLATALFDAAAKAESDGHDVHNKIFSLLYEICQARLRFDRPKNPFEDNLAESEDCPKKGFWADRI